MRILVVEDEKNIASNIAEYLRQQSFAVDIAYEGEKAWQAIQDTPYDVVLLDWMLPGLSGMDLCKKLRAENSEVAIIMLTAKDALEDKLTGLNEGADDYIVKPFELRELGARIQALLRRRDKNQSKTNVLRVGDLTLDVETQEVKRQKKKIRLTRKLYQILELLMRNKNRILSKKEIETHIWDSSAELWSDVVRSHIQKLREKIDKGHSQKLLRTVHGMGYKITDIKE